METKTPCILTLLLALLCLSACSNDDHIYDGTFRIQGKISDDYTLEGIPNVSVSVQGVSSSLGGFGGRLDLGEFTTNSSGYFSGKIRKPKDVERYDFVMIADEHYYSLVIDRGVAEVENNPLSLSFLLARYTELEIHVEKKVSADIPDTLYVSWSVINSQIIGPFDPITFEGTQPDVGHRWIGGEVKALIKTRALANKELEIIWDLYREGSRTFKVDTLYCERNTLNTFTIHY